MSKIEPEAQNHGQTDSCKQGGLIKESEKISQKTYMKDPWTWAMEKGLIMEVGVGWVEGKQRRKKWDNCKSINYKILKK